MKPASSFAIYRRFYQHLAKGQRSRFFALLALGFATVIFDLAGIAVLFAAVLKVVDPGGLSHWSIANGVDRVIGNPENQTLVLIGILVGLYILKNLITYGIGLLQLRLAYNLSKEISRKQIIEFFNIDYTDLKQQPIAEHIHRIYAIPNSFVEQLILPTSQAATELLLLVMSIVILAIWKPLLLAFLGITVLPVALVLITLNRKRLNQLGNETNETIPKLFLNVSDIGKGLPIIRIRGLEDRFIDNFIQLRDHFFSLKQRGYRISSIAPPRVMESAAVLMLFMIAFYAYLTDTFNELPILLAAFGALAFRLLPSINRLISANNTVQSFSFLIDFLPKNMEHVEDFSSTSSEVMPFNKSLEVNRICFSYGERKVLNGVSFNLKAGSIMGIQGESGVGKTTLINCIMGLITPDEGSITCDGINIREDLRAWRKNISYVGQDAFLTADSILNNITLAEDNPDRERVERIVRSLNLSDWLNELSEGLDTLIGEDGKLVSGGQRQRLAIARALYFKSSILILDEPTSSLDEESKADVMEAIQTTNKNGVTILLISHDTSNMVICNNLYQLNENGLVEKGR